MEDLMRIDSTDYHSDSGLPKNEAYLEKGLPPYLQKSLELLKSSWKRKDNGKPDLHWDLYWCELNADINSAETEQEISSEQAQYLRHKYLRMETE